VEEGDGGEGALMLRLMRLFCAELEGEAGAVVGVAYFDALVVGGGSHGGLSQWIARSAGVK
jgi:hypothetical protein